MFNKFHQTLINNYQAGIRKQVSHPRFNAVNFRDAYHLDRNSLLLQITRRDNNYVLLFGDDQFFNIDKAFIECNVIQQLIPKHLLTYYPELLL